ncbi:oligomeric golgi complex component, COG2-domain-containing protein [Chytriomyces sp. MP71]|nr:oligomeric golgi complex component, COG2-domain-containing protein [Chytriomyces sp. MP71]
MALEEPFKIIPEEEEGDEDTDEFIARRIHSVPLAVLRQDATARLSGLKADLVDLINSDYASFIAISTSLKGYSPVPEGFVLVEARNKLLAARKILQSMADNVQNLLAQRAALRDRKTTLQTFISIEESIRKLEGLLNIEQAVSVAPAAENTAGTPKREDDGKLIERVAVEFNHLLFLVSSTDKKIKDAGSGGKEEAALLFVKNLSWRIDRIKSALTSILKETLDANIIAVSSRPNDPAAAAALTQTLRTYLLIDRPRDAGAQYRAICTPDLQSLATQSSPRDSDNGLARFFNQVQAHLATPRIARVLALSRAVFGGLAYDLLADELLPVVWGLVARHHGGAWNAGLPDAFQANYVATRAFLACVERVHCDGDDKVVAHLREVKETVEFLRKWNLEVYHRIRVKEIVAPYDLACHATLADLTVLAPAAAVNGLRLTQSVALLAALRRIWAKDVFLDALVVGSWTLTLQCCNRYVSWTRALVDGFTGAVTAVAMEVSAAAGGTTGPGAAAGTESVAVASATAGVSGTPVTHSTPPVVSAAQMEDTVLANVAAVFDDAARLNDILLSVFDHVITPCLPAGFPSVDVLRSQIAAISKDVHTALYVPLQEKSGAVLNKRCCVALEQVSVVVQTTRFSSKAPTAASTYVSKVIMPAAEFFKGLREEGVLDESVPAALDTLRAWKSFIADSVCSKYHAIVSKQLEDAAQLDRFSQRRRTGKVAAGGAATTANGEGAGPSTPFEKIKEQMRIDVKQFLVQLQEGFGDIGGEGIEGLESLKLLKSIVA